jgi:glycosyltransferase involved in cell wall biosynthesis
MALGPRALRILMPTPRCLPEIGGVERYVASLSRCLVELGVDVTVVAADPLRTEPPHEHVDGVEIFRVPAYPRNRDYYFAPELYRIVRGGTWDLVHVQSYHTLIAPLAMLAARRAHVPYVLTFHGSTLRRFQWPVLRPLLVRANRLVALARFEIELYRGALKLPRDRFALIRPGIDRPGNRRAPRSGDPREPVIASVGRLVRCKGHHRLIEALPEIIRRRPDARIWIAGSGPYEQALKRRARELGVAERVEIRAVRAEDPQAMADELSEVALVVLFSDAETVPIAVLEALALGRPVLVTRNRGLDELADEGLVRAVPADSGPDEVAAAVVEQLGDPFVPAHVDLPTWEECAAQHHELYISLLEQRGRSAAAMARPRVVISGRRRRAQ